MGQVISLVDRFQEIIFLEDTYGHGLIAKKYCPKCKKENEWVTLSEMASFWGCKVCNEVN